MSFAYIKSGFPDSARIYLNRFLKDNDSLYYKCYYDYNLYSGNTADALEGLKIDMREQNKVLQTIATQSLSETIRLYHENQLGVAQKRADINRLTAWSTAIVALLILSIISLIYKSRLTQKRLEVEAYIANAESLTNDIKNINNALSKANSKIQDLFSRQFELLNHYCATYYEINDSSKAQKAIFDNISEQINMLVNQKSIELIEKLINENFDNLLIKLHAELPRLKTHEYRIFIYSVMGFSARSICFMLSLKPETLYNRKAYLKKKIKESESTYRDIFLSYL
ncbi:MAG: hypothetical protein K2M97_01570 [Muribaculaceae bacterium]|nr:hypothetical protein [Muribaculaceae bacterium]